MKFREANAAELACIQEAFRKAKADAGDAPEPLEEFPRALRYRLEEKLGLLVFQAEGPRLTATSKHPGDDGMHLQFEVQF